MEKYELLKHIGIIGKRGDNALELNLISWNGGEPKFDIREWSADHETISHGVTLTRDELNALANILQK